MNNECLKLKDHSSGFQTEEEIQSIVMQAIGTSHVQDDDFDDDAMVPLPFNPHLPNPLRPLSSHAHTHFCWLLELLVHLALDIPDPPS